MDVFTHTLLAVGSLMGFFFVGEYFGKKNLSEEKTADIVDHTISMLERDGFIRLEKSKDNDGDWELVPISEIITEVLRNAKT